ncbi:MAG TPA: hypothetical protein VJM33_11425 [Microthrixaceae bacterium]|nr:hypothetical protein [Microthrixaceae bacterium]
MIVAIVIFLLAALAANVAWKASRPMFEQPAFERQNYRGHTLPTSVGVLIPIVTAAVVALYRLVFDPWRQFVSGWLVDLEPLKTLGGSMVAITIAFSFLGLIDDIGGTGQSGGFRGHVRSLSEGRLTTGMLKLLGGPLVAIAIVGGSVPSEGRIDVLRDAAIVCLAANLCNLFDRAPGRVIKVSVVGLVLLVVVNFDTALTPVVIPIGAAVGLLRGDLREQLMLGDAGANALGAALGFMALFSVGSEWLWVLLAVLLALNLISELVSFTSVIDNVGPLRWLDRWGSPYRS